MRDRVFYGHQVGVQGAQQRAEARGSDVDHGVPRAGRYPRVHRTTLLLAEVLPRVSPSVGQVRSGRLFNAIRLVKSTLNTVREFTVKNLVKFSSMVNGHIEIPAQKSLVADMPWDTVRPTLK